MVSSMVNSGVVLNAFHVTRPDDGESGGVSCLCIWKLSDTDDVVITLGKEEL